ncbi:MAG: Xaa-Pro peptidase family protein [Dongiaceae bacterium]
MALHFSREELAGRQARAMEAMQARGLDGMLLFRQESMFYLTGYDTVGYVFFQCLYFGADGRLMLLTRSPDLLQAQLTSVIEDIRIWVDAPDVNPSQELKSILADFGLSGKRLGVEYESYGLTGRNGMRLNAALDGFCTLEDESELVTRLRVVKSLAEIEYVRKAAALADTALGEANRLAGPGAFEGDILAAMQSVILRGGGDDAASEFIIGSGKAALLCRYFTGRRHLDPVDQLTLEFAGVYRHYHACLMRTIPIGKVPPQQRDMHKLAVEALFESEAALKPGRPIGEVFDAYARICDAAGYRKHRLNATGYSLGTTFAPNWMDWPMFYHANSVEAAPGMVFFIHIMIFDSETGIAMTHGRTSLVTANGAEPLSKASLELVVG